MWGVYAVSLCCIDTPYASYEKPLGHRVYRHLLESGSAAYFQCLGNSAIINNTGCIGSSTGVYRQLVVCLSVCFFRMDLSALRVCVPHYEEVAEGHVAFKVAVKYAKLSWEGQLLLLLLFLLMLILLFALVAASAAARHSSVLLTFAAAFAPAGNLICCCCISALVLLGLDVAAGTHC